MGPVGRHVRVLACLGGGLMCFVYYLFLVPVVRFSDLFSPVPAPPSHNTIVDGYF